MSLSHRSSQVEYILSSVRFSNVELHKLALAATARENGNILSASQQRDGPYVAGTTFKTQAQGNISTLGFASSAGIEQPKINVPLVKPNNTSNGLTSYILPGVNGNVTLGTSNGFALSTVGQQQVASSSVSLTNGNGVVTSGTSAERLTQQSVQVLSGNYERSTLSTLSGQLKPALLGVSDTVPVRTRTVSGLSNRPVTPAITEMRAVIQKEEWLEAARRSTERFKMQGSPVPLVWVLTEYNKIPENAVPFGQDRNGCTLYIARALLEGSLHIGKASVQSSGAVIGYAGRECTAFNYEVLVFASQLRWDFPPAVPEGFLAQGTVVVSQQQQKYRDAEGLTEGDLPRIIRDNTEIGGPRPPVVEDLGSLKRLAEVKTVIIIDDSLSMQEGDLWAQARRALGGIVDIANQHGSKGADIYFMDSNSYAVNMQSKSDVDALFDEVQPEGDETPTGRTLAKIINQYVPFIEDKQSTHEPIVVVVITDGVPTDQERLDDVIVDVANRLDLHEVKNEMFRIQFIQIGTNPEASKLLHVLDDGLVNRYNIRDIVDCTPYDPAQGAFDTKYMLKILLGGLPKETDVAVSINGGQPSVLSNTASGYESSSLNVQLEY